MGMPELEGLDPSAYAEPMELYDSIFWGAYLSVMPFSGSFMSTSL